MDWTIVMKKIPVGTSVEAVHATMSEFGLIKLIKMQLDAVCVVRANVNKQTWDSRDEFRVLLYTLSVGTNAYDLWNFVGLVGGKTCVIDHNPVSYAHAYCATVCFGSESDLVSAMAATPVIKRIGLHWFYLSLALCLVCSLSGHTSLNCVLVKVGSTLRGRKTPLSAQNQIRLVTIYAWKSTFISCPLVFSGKTWASVVGALLVCNSHGAGLFLGFNNVGKPLPSAANDLEKCLVRIESSLISLAEQIGELAKRLELFMLAVSQPSSGCQLPVTPSSQNQEENIVMGVGSGDATSNKTAAILGSTVSPEVVKLENMLENLFALVMILSTHLDGLALQNDVIHWHKDINNLVSIFTKSKLKRKVCPWLTNKFDGVRVFTSGLNSGSLGAKVLIIMNSSLAKHVCKVSEVPGQLLSIKFLFKNKLSVSILRLYAGASSVVWFSQAGEINSLIAKAINEFSFVILGGDFNEDSLHKCASFKKCFDLGLINSLGGSSFVKSPTWCNFCGITKTIDYMFVSSNLVGAVIDYGVDGVENYFDTDHKAVYVSVGLKYDIKNASEIKWSEFRVVMAANAVMFSDEFVAAKQFSDLDVMWDIVHKVMVLSAGRTFKKKWFKSFDCVFNKAIEKRMESFEVNKDHTIRSVLECPFHKVVLDHLVDGEELVLEPDLVKSKINGIMESWTRKHVVTSDISGNWARQFRSLDHVFNGAFFNVIHSISFDEMFGVISNLPDGKAAGLSSITNEL
ncbi:hypothetical protein G9A89_016040 [Geosiphon pyriformis]|nr:hypothetical protein G9A89_016040 [Geosiphon pyriformis]